MRVLYLGNNWLGWELLKIIRQHGDEITTLVVHPPERCKFGTEIIETAGVDSDQILEAATLASPAALSVIRKAAPEIAVSVMFGYILRPNFLHLFPRGCINLHPSLLPYNRGSYPNVWSIVDGTPAGVTIHFMDEGIDTGDVIAQAEVPIEPGDTGESLYRKLERRAVALFAEAWPRIRVGQIERNPQSKEIGTYHRIKDVTRIDEIDLDRTYRAGDLIDVIRARTFAGYRGAYFRQGGRKVYLRLVLDPDEVDQR
jgi:methionyl-tRNA formyltransferase